MSKRKLASFSLAAVTLFALSGCASAASSDVSTPGAGGSPVALTFASYGGSFQDAQTKAWQEPYTAANPNVTFNNTSPSDVAQIKAQVTAGAVSWDLADVPAYFAAEQCGTLVEPLSVPGLDATQYNEGIIGKCYVGHYQYALILSYNTTKWPDAATAPKTVADYFDTSKFPGKRGVVGAVSDGILEYALLADGVKPAALYPLDVDRALNKWSTIKSDTTFAANNGALLQLVTDKQVDMQLMVAARTKAALDAGATLKPVWDVTMTNFGSLVIPKGSPNKAAAEQFMSYLLQPEQSAKFAELSGTAPSNKSAKPTLSANAGLVNAFDSTNTGTTQQVNADWWSQNFAATAATFTTWLNG